MLPQPSADTAEPAVILRSGKSLEPVLSSHIPPLFLIRASAPEKPANPPAPEGGACGTRSH